jgi:hypothetical protein
MAEEVKQEEKPTEELRKLPDMSKEEMKEFILGVCNGQIFTDRHCHNPNDIPLVFMVIALGGLGGLDLEDLGCIYEFMSEAGPRSVNGMPCFFSCRLMNKKDAGFAFKMVAQEMDRRANMDLQLEINTKDGNEK